MKISKKALKYFTANLELPVNQIYVAIKQGLKGYDKICKAEFKHEKSKPVIYVTVSTDKTVVLRYGVLSTKKQLGYKENELLVCIHYLKDGLVEDLFIPVRFLNDRVVDKHLVYRHCMTVFDEAMSQIVPRSYKYVNYVGRTKQGWQKRYSQHLSGSGGARGFYQAINNDLVRKYRSSKQVVSYYIEESNKTHSPNKTMAAFNHCILEAGLTFKEVVEKEAYWIDKLSKYPKGNNFSPGGWEEIKWLKENGVKFENKEPTDDDMDRAWKKAHRSRRLRKVAKLSEEQLIAKLWKMTTANDRTLNPETAIHIRLLYLGGHSISEIIKMVEGVSFAQAENVIKGRTYVWAK